jgi:GT2 family glycosyltransferase
MIQACAIVILNYKNYQDTINCIESIYRSKSNEKFSIIVVDNYSCNQSLERVEEHFVGKVDIANFDSGKLIVNDIILVQCYQNSGYAAGNNVGLKIGHKLGFKYLMVLNNDTLFTDYCLDNLVKELDKRRNTLCVGPVLVKKDGSPDYNCAKRRPKLYDFFIMSYFGRWMKTQQWHKNYYYLKRYVKLTDTINVDIISGSCMLFLAEKFSGINFFDEQTFLYFEEAILSEKAINAKLDIFLVPSSVVIHLGAQTTKTHSKSDFTIKCEYDSAIYYLVNYRRLSYATAKFICLGQLVFLKLYRLKNKLS